MTIKKLLSDISIDDVLPYIKEPIVYVNYASYDNAVFRVVPEKISPVMEDLRKTGDYRDAFSKNGYRYNSHMAVANFFFLLSDLLKDRLHKKFIEHGIPMSECDIYLNDFIREEPLMNDGEDAIYKDIQSVIHLVDNWGVENTISAIGRACDDFEISDLKKYIIVYAKEIVWIKELILYIAKCNKKSSDTPETKALLSYSRAFICTTLTCLILEDDTVRDDKEIKKDMK